MTWIIAATFSGCTSPKSEATAHPAEPLPELLTSLPQQAIVKCKNDPALDRGSTWLWSLPGNNIPDDSGVSGQRGDEIGKVGFCEPIQIIDFYWDPYGAEYWAKIETNDLAGWVPFHLVMAE